MLKGVGDKTTQTEEGDPAGSSRATSPASSTPSGEDAGGKDWFIVENIKLRKQIKSLKGEYEKVNRNLSIRCELLQNKQQIIPSDNFYLQLDKILRRKRKGKKYKNNATQTDITFMSPFFAKWDSYLEDSALNRISSDGDMEVLKKKRITKRVSEIRYQYKCANEVCRRSDNQRGNKNSPQRKYPSCGKARAVPPTRPSTNMFKVPNHVIHKDNVLYSLYTDNDLIFIREISEDLIPKGGEKKDAVEGKLMREGKNVQTESSLLENPTEGERINDLLTHMNEDETSQVEDNNSSHVVLSQDEENKHENTCSRTGGGKGMKEYAAETYPGIAKGDKYNDVLLKHQRGYTSSEGSGTTLTDPTHTPHGRASHAKISQKGREEVATTPEERRQSTGFVSSRRKKKEAPTSSEMGVATRAPIYLGGITTEPEHTADNATAPQCDDNDNNPLLAQKHRKKKNKQIRQCDCSPLGTKMETRMEPSEWNNPLRGEAQRNSDTPWRRKTSYPFVKFDADSYSAEQTCPAHGEATPKMGILPLPLWDAKHRGTTHPLEGRHHNISLSDAEKKSAKEIRKIYLDHKKRAFLFYM
ncbi:hypothetical protein AK88_04378 [Plasmodium fragile]|uniref:Uncharacterized protein n=1 Tax=Plasmodium fragile TaxID=5857 RepID=A0A0D9QG30_PLAFR|nr:uncharacterized protein AK88_04378 [Plasmodium fragile]KJP85969.1 hypothetical protein AK88_04378 [Plasmodium fragile]